MLANIRDLSRLENVAETLRHALNQLAVEAPDWLRAHAEPAWVERYGMWKGRLRKPIGAVICATLATLDWRKPISKT